MARIRTVKPEFFTSEQLAECSATTRLLFIGLWCFCDDAGVHPASAKRLKMEVFPADAITDEEMKSMIRELIGNNLLIEFESEGQAYWHVPTWSKHQKIEKPTFRYPRPDAPNSVITQPVVGEASPNGRRTLGHGMESNGMESNGMEERAPESPAARSDKPGDIPQAIPEKLSELIAAWNELPHGIAPRVRKPHSEEISKGWKRTRKNADVVAALDDVAKLMDAIRQATFCHGQGWFEFAWLMAKDDIARWNVLKVIDGNFRNSSKSLTIGPGQTAAGDESRY